MSKLLNRIQFFTKLLGAKITRQNIPLVVILNTTNSCNLNCVYCYGPYPERKTRNFTAKELFSLIDELANMGTMSITLGGGEPLIRQDIGDLIDYIKSKKIECGMNSNGTLIPQKLEAVKKLDSICVSLDGDESANDASRGAGSYKKIMEGITTAKKNGVVVHTNTVITKNNLNALDYLMDKAKEIGFVAEFNLPFYQVSANKDRDCLQMTNDECRGAILKIISYIQKGYPLLFSEKVHRYVASWPNYKQYMYRGQKPPFRHIKCQTGRFMCFIDADGHVYPCAQLVGTFPALNFLEVGFKKAWENLSNHDCHACYFVCFNEFNSIFNLDLGVIFGAAKNTIRDILLRSH